MTFITLLTISDGNLYLVKGHYRAIQNDLLHNLIANKPRGKKIAELKEGYILLDTKNRIIVNQQNCTRLGMRPGAMNGYSLII